MVNVHCPKGPRPIHDVVVMAVRKAVSAATITFYKMTGFKWWRTILVMSVSYLSFFFIMLILLFAGYYIMEL